MREIAEMAWSLKREELSRRESSSSDAKCHCLDLGFWVFLFVREEESLNRGKKKLAGAANEFEVGFEPECCPNPIFVPWKRLRGSGIF